jgi:hypothetical protein
MLRAWPDVLAEVALDLGDQRAADIVGCRSTGCVVLTRAPIWSEQNTPQSLPRFDPLPDHPKGRGSDVDLVVDLLALLRHRQVPMEGDQTMTTYDDMGPEDEGEGEEGEAEAQP